jgi:UDP-N-acetylglucosamine 2-epimerase
MKIVTIVGARPQFVKIAPVSRAIKEHNNESYDQKAHIREILVHTGQHYDYEMSQVFFDELGISRPQYHLEVGPGTHAETTGKMLTRIETVLIDERPSRVLIYGDTNSTLAGALAASKLHIPIAHVEAGLRSFNRRMPEEVNRVVADHLSDLFFCPTETAVMNLQVEGITQGVLNSGDVMFDAFLMNKNVALKKSRIFRKLGLQKDYCLATVHRQENTDDPERLVNIFSSLNHLAGLGYVIVLPLHPRTRKALKKNIDGHQFDSNLKMISPVGYLDFVALESRAQIILTDSGGIQKEAFFAKVPCITLRDETEWVETVEAGWNYLTGADKESIQRAFHEAVQTKKPAELPEIFGRGNASGLIVNRLAEVQNSERRITSHTKVN